jgi:Cupin-like domain
MTATVPEYRNVDRGLFEREIVPGGRSAILRGLVADWPVVAAASESAESLATYLRGHATDGAAESWFGPPEIAGRFDFVDDFRGYNHDRKMATIDQLLELILRQREAAQPWSIYAGALPLARHAPGLLADNPMPLLDPMREMLVSLWLGNRTVTAAHWDLPQNLACVVAGRRRFTLFPTDQVANLYVGPIDRTLAGQPSSMVDVDAPDFERFPRFREALAAAEIAELEPGDALYMPSLWWHSVRSQDAVGAMVNFWWRDDPANEVTPMLSLMHAAMTMRGLPANERAAWKAFFDHYVFQADGDPVAHLPENARGLIGGDTESIAAFRARLAATLR